MSFDVYIFRPKNARPFTEDEVERQISLIAGFKKNQDDEYVVAGTDQVVLFDLEDDMLGEMEEEEWDTPLVKLAISPILVATIQYGVPESLIGKYFYALQNLAGKLNALMFDPQTDQATSAEQLSASWATSNSFAASALNAHTNAALNWSVDKQEYIKKYMEALPVLTEHWARSDVFVPKIFAITASSNNITYSCAVWPDCIQQVFPEVDYLYIQRKASGLSGLLGKKKTGYIRLSAAKYLLSGNLEKQNDPVVYHVYKSGNDDSRIIQGMQRIPIEPDSSFEIKPLA
jgi:hypothetical protein